MQNGLIFAAAGAVLPLVIWRNWNVLPCPAGSRAGDGGRPRKPCCSLHWAFGDKRSAELVASRRAPSTAEERAVFQKILRDEEIPYLQGI